MKTQIIQRDALQLLGFTVRTNNHNEMQPDTPKTTDLAAHYLENQLAQYMIHRRQPGVTYSVYTEFESDEHGDYTYFIGEAVTTLEGQDLNTFTPLTLPPSRYLVLRTPPGKMPDIVIKAWQAIWATPPEEFAQQTGGRKRTYIADFEIYDEKAADPNNAVVDIYIGIESGRK